MPALFGCRKDPVIRSPGHPSSSRCSESTTPSIGGFDGRRSSRAGPFVAVLHGHTHVPNFYTKKGVLYFNPGFCVPRRFHLPVTLGSLTLAADEKLEAEFVPLIPA